MTVAKSWAARLWLRPRVDFVCACLGVLLCIAPMSGVAADKSSKKLAPAPESKIHKSGVNKNKLAPQNNKKSKNSKINERLEEENTSALAPLQAPENSSIAPHMLPFSLPELPAPTTANRAAAPNLGPTVPAELITPAPPRPQLPSTSPAKVVETAPHSTIGGLGSLPALEPKSYRHFTLIPYRGDSSDVAKSDLAKILESIKKEYTNFSITSVLVQVYGDKSVPPEQSLRLSQVLAHNTQKELINLGVPPEKIQTLGLGPQEAKECRGNTACHAQNRHIDITVMLTVP